jgi:hypothetical protein
MRKTTKRKKIYARIDPIAHAIAGATITPEFALNKLRTIELSAMESFTKGAATVEDWGVLSAMLNVCETFASEGIGAEAMPSCEALQNELISASNRYKHGKGMGMSGLGLKAMRDTYEYADLQRSSVDRATFEKIITLTKHRTIGKSKRVTAL